MWEKASVVRMRLQGGGFMAGNEETLLRQLAKAAQLMPVIPNNLLFLLLLPFSSLTCGCKCPTAMPRELFEEDKQLRAKGVSLGQERPAPGWKLTAGLYIPAGDQQHQITSCIFKEYRFWPWDVLEGKGKGGVTQLHSSCCFNLQAGSGFAAQGRLQKSPS